MNPGAETFAPLMLLAAVGLALPRGWLKRRAVQAALVAALALVVARYMWWRVTETVLPAEGLDAGSVFVWTLFLIELTAWFDAGVMFAALLRRADRSAEADRLEAALRARPPESLPEVDVYIATYDEPPEVLERTLVGALALRWPRDRLKVWVLDDGRRDWLREACARRGAGYLTRPDNAHAKAGNINAAIRRTRGEFFMVLDADFVPQQDFLYRAMGFFEDPRVGIVQIPHNFFNPDPMQTNLGLQRVLPDDQRLFFDAIMPGRDGWDCAFCCGSNSITRRAAIEAAGGGLPTGSITEDMLLTLVLLRKGYVTRYLNERLAVGLAPESLSAFFVQRARWARGAMQILHLRDGPLGPGLRLHERIMFLPTHWLSQALSQTAALATPAIYLWTGLLPMLNVTAEAVIAYQLPAIFGAILAARLLAPREFFPLAATAHASLQALRLLPVVLSTLIRPRGHAFRVTPKGAAAGAGAAVDRPTQRIAVGLMLATGAGLWLNADFDMQIVTDESLVPVVSFWSIFNMLVLAVVAAMAVSPPRLRGEERFSLDEPCRLLLRGAAAPVGARLADLSLSGALVAPREGAEGEALRSLAPGDWAVLEIRGAGRAPARVRRAAQGAGGSLGLALHPPAPAWRDALIRRLFTQGLDNSTHRRDAWAVVWGMLARVLRSDAAPDRAEAASAPEDPPDWALAACRRNDGAPGAAEGEAAGALAPRRACSPPGDAALGARRVA